MLDLKVYKPNVMRRVQFCVVIFIVFVLSFSLFFLYPKDAQVEARVMIARSLSIVLFFVFVWGGVDLFRLSKGRLEVGEKAIKYGVSDQPDSIVWEQIATATYYSNMKTLEVREKGSSVFELKTIKLYEYQVNDEEFLEVLRHNSGIYKFQLNIDNCE
ncbi:MULTISPECIES: hypothetical protein [Pseudoalteromonas]|uniref:Uncharacterized protein n=1 Tax=Pseudoalteromonas amylolytica TaxID=1859457 RepID=A0A1S1MV60_9GAMM|nr:MULTISPECIES: hypothetical protein [Pseudoalteromonas]OHU86202.1 hypothetical protein BFC16_15985 [Pseudoalteromonas sp. JW3]OHU89692.1 hypothetical protein BET10_16335 [Pseudoalteromonas amylolytica]